MPDQILVGDRLLPTAQIQQVAPPRPDLWEVGLIDDKTLAELRSGMFDVELLFKYLERCYTSGGFGAVFCLLNWYLGMSPIWQDKPAQAATLRSISLKALRQLFDRYSPEIESKQRADADVMNRDEFYEEFKCESGLMEAQDVSPSRIKMAQHFSLSRDLLERKKDFDFIEDYKASESRKELARTALVSELYIVYLNRQLNHECGELVNDVMRLVPLKPWKSILKKGPNAKLYFKEIDQASARQIYSRFSGNAASSYPIKLQRALNDRNISILRRVFETLLARDLVGLSFGDKYPLSDTEFGGLFETVAVGAGKKTGATDQGHTSREHYSTKEGAELTMGIVAGAMGPMGKLHGVHKKLDDLMDPIVVPEQRIRDLELDVHQYTKAAESNGLLEMEALDQFSARADQLQDEMAAYSLDMRAAQLREVEQSAAGLIDEYERYEGQYATVSERYDKLLDGLLLKMEATLTAVKAANSKAERARNLRQVRDYSKLVTALSNEITLLNLKKRYATQVKEEDQSTEKVRESLLLLKQRINAFEKKLNPTNPTKMQYFQRIGQIFQNISIDTSDVQNMVGEFERVARVKSTFESELRDLQGCFGRLKAHILAARNLLYVAAIQYSQQMIRLGFIYALIDSFSAMTHRMETGFVALGKSLLEGDSYSQFMETLELEESGENGVKTHLSDYFKMAPDTQTVVETAVFGVEDADPETQTSYQRVQSHIGVLLSAVAETRALQAKESSWNREFSSGVDASRLQAIREQIHHNDLLAKQKFALVLSTYHDEWELLWEQGVEALRQEKITVMAVAFRENVERKMAGRQADYENDFRAQLDRGVALDEVEARRLDAVETLKAEIEVERRRLVVGDGTRDYIVLDGVAEALIADYATLSLEGGAHGNTQTVGENQLFGMPSPDSMNVTARPEDLTSLQQFHPV
ncbi:MAG: hypothetical protein O3A01_09255, partial [bacterium]|nr:hypothetical protein [bacterium]